MPVAKPGWYYGYHWDVVINLILSVILMQVFAHAGLALATSLSLW